MTESSSSLTRVANRPRRRKGKQRSSVVNSYSQFITHKLSAGAQEYVWKHGSPLPGAARMRLSQRWYPLKGCPSHGYDFPFVDQLGRFTGHSLGRGLFTPNTFVSSVVSTIATRLEMYSRKHNDYRFVKKYEDMLVRASFVYAVTKNLYFWNRVLFISRDLKMRGPQFHKLILKFLCKTDACTRFVYGQVCLQTDWFLFRAERPRDKSPIGKVVAQSDSQVETHSGQRLSRFHAIVRIANAIRTLA